MALTSNQLELLAPAKTAEIGKQAVLHGADAVYIGGPSFGARLNAGNSISEIAELVSFAHLYRSRIFVTLNTILHDAELEPARQLIWQLYDAGVDALIVQDMGLLELDLPPIELHASTQTDIRSVEKAKFLADVGFSQIVLARELTLPQIQAIHQATDTTLEFFIHGALCVAYSGQCYISHAQTGRSANRGDCSQSCRLPYTLTDQQGGVVAFDKHLLSVKDNNQSDNLAALIDAGIRAFKIEGRYKDAPYVKNITAHYRQLLDEILTQRSDLQASSSGRCSYTFTPNPDKTFHRGATDYFVTGRKVDIGAFDTPTFVGIKLGDVTQIGKSWFEMSANEPLHNGDGLSYLYKREAQGTRINRVEQHGDVWRVFPNDEISALKGLKVGTEISRNRDHAWELALTKPSAERKIDLDLTLSEDQQGLLLSASDYDGFHAQVSLALDYQETKQLDKLQENLQQSLSKLGNTIFSVRDIHIQLTRPWFIPASQLNNLRRQVIESLLAVRAKGLERFTRKPEVVPPAIYSEDSLSYLANVYNQKARDFYARHGVKVVDAAYESHQEAGEVSLMITKHCLRFSFNLCPKQAKGVQGVQGQVTAEPMVLMNGNDKLTLKFDCAPCEMHVMGKIRKPILNSPSPSWIPIEIKGLKAKK